MEEFKQLTECLVCGSENLVEFSNLGLQPLVNNLKNTPDEADKKFPLIVNLCTHCTHKQLSIAVDRKLLFSDYLYRTGTSDSHIKFFEKFADIIGFPKCWTRILDIGCNDGSMLKIFKDKGWQCFGIEPATQLASEAMMKGLHVTCDFFPTSHAFNKKFHCITAFNVLAHNSDPSFFLEEMVKLLEPNGKIYVLTTPARMDNFYHEHISYFTPRSMMALAAHCGLTMTSFKEVSMHGISYIFELTKREEQLSPDLSEAKFLSNRFGGVVGYGASAACGVLLNYFNFRPEYIIDDNELKQGKYIPGVDVPVFNSQHIAADERNLAIIIFAYHLFDDIVSKIKLLRPNAKDTFIHPIKGVI